MAKNQVDEGSIIQLYSSGKSTREVASVCNVSQTQVRRILSRHDVKAHEIKTSSEIEDIIVQRYKDGDSSEKISKDLDLNASTVCRVLKRNNIELKKAKHFNRKYQINEDFLDEINTQEKAYFLGFMYADGCVHKRKTNFNLTLHQQDVDILEIFSNIFYGFNKVVTTDGGYRALTIYSAKLCSKLIQNGCMPAKTFKVQLPKLPKELLSHFLRGVYDGDGCINLCESGRVRVILTGYSEFLKEIQDYLSTRGISGILRIVKGDNVASFVVSKNYDTKAFLEYLYKDATIYLNRKYEKYLICKDILNQKTAPSANYGSSNIVSYNGTKLTKKYIESLSVPEKDKIVDFLFDYFRKNGFPYESIDDNEMMNDFENLCNTEVKVVNNELRELSNGGLKLFKNFCHHYYKVSGGKQPSLIDAFNDDAKLRKAIQNRLGYFFDTGEAFNITGNMLRQGLRNSRIAFAASIFKPSVAKFFYDHFKAENVLDISAGFGQRMVGAYASKSVKRYVGLDPWRDTIEALTNIQDFLSFTGKDFSLVEIGSEDFISDERFDFCFSSPPFFNKEVYTQHNKQAYSNGLEGFMDYWVKTAKNVHTMLSGKYFVINMDSKMIIDMLAAVSDLFVQEDLYKISFKRAHLPSDSYDYYYVLRKVGS